MRKPLVLTAYLALHHARAAPPPRFLARPNGPVVWIHCADPEKLVAAASLATLLRADGDQMCIIATTSSVTPQVDGVIPLPIPADAGPDVRDFLDHWRPDTLVWLDGPLRPALLAEAASRNMTRMILDVTETNPDIAVKSRVPGLARAALGLFDTAFCADPRARARLERAGLPASGIIAAETFDPGVTVLPCVEAERAELAALLTSRPVWLVAAPPQSELAPLLTAYHIASQRAHRLLMIVATGTPESAKTDLTAQGHSLCDHTIGELPKASSQILLTDTDTMGLWYRLAPVTYIGGSLRGGQEIDPFDAAALGSVVIHGLKTPHHRDRFEQLGQAKACRMVQSETELGRVIETLLSPDKAAQMAHAAWDVTSKGAQTGNLVAQMVLSRLDQNGG